MTDAEREERKAEAARKRGERLAREARKRSAALERRELAAITRVKHRIPEETMRALEYIRRQIAAGHRTPEDVADLRKTRRNHLRPYLPKGVN